MEAEEFANDDADGGEEFELNEAAFDADEMAHRAFQTVETTEEIKKQMDHYFDPNGRICIAKNVDEVTELAKLLKKDDAETRNAFCENMITFLACSSYATLRSQEVQRTETMYLNMVTLFDQVCNISY